MVQSHKKVKHAEGELQYCSECNYSNRSKETLTRHKVSQHGFVRGEGKEPGTGKPYSLTFSEHQCDKCEFRCVGKYYLKAHMEEVHDGLVHQCDHCEFSTPKKQKLKVHVKTVHEGKYFFCDKCDFKGGRKCDLLRHVKRHEKGTVRKYEKIDNYNFDHPKTEAERNAFFYCDLCDFRYLLPEHFC